MKQSVQNQEQHQFTIGSAPTSKYIIQSFYKEQLDTLMQEKNKQKQLSRQQKQKQKQDYNQRIRQMNQLEELKTLSYKNYYQMLMENQNRNYTQFVPNNRDEIKDGHISRHSQVEKDRNIEMQIKQREREMKESYKEQLTRQMEQKRRVKSVQKIQEKLPEGLDSRSKSRLEEWEQKKKINDQINYKEILDRETKEKERSKSTKHYLNKINQFNIDEYSQHNPLNNPLPYNIQNPYIMRQMMKSSLGRNQSYLSSVAGSSF